MKYKHKRRFKFTKAQLKFFSGFLTNLSAAFFGAMVISPNFIETTNLVSMLTLFLDLILTIVCAITAIKIEEKLT